MKSHEAANRQDHRCAPLPRDMSIAPELEVSLPFILATAAVALEEPFVNSRGKALGTACVHLLWGKSVRCLQVC